uniref:Uncharacterized protein n=1 Tax=Solanum lycopersicum TaxID=4081 RepID=A0A3Q7HPL5_SOLLC
MAGLNMSDMARRHRGEISMLKGGVRVSEGGSMAERHYGKTYTSNDGSDDNPWVGGCVLMMTEGYYAIDNFRKYYKRQKERDMKLKVLREENQQREDRILAENESCFPIHPYMHSTPLSGTRLD